MFSVDGNLNGEMEIQQSNRNHKQNQVETLEQKNILYEIKMN